MLRNKAPGKVVTEPTLTSSGNGPLNLKLPPPISTTFNFSAEDKSSVFSTAPRAIAPSEP